MMDEDRSFGQWLRSRRRELDLTQNSLGQAIGCAQVTIRKIEADALHPSRQLSQLLVEKLGVPTDQQEIYIRYARTGIFPSDPIEACSSTNLPHALTSFIGRKREVEEIRRILPAHRLVTLYGAGGSGKTRLAIQAAAGITKAYPDGIWSVELASISDPEIVPQVVAGVFGVQRSGEASYQSSLIHFLREKELLLILDNCEHLIEACVSLVNALSGHCPSITILATSRETLGIPGEKTYRVPSMTTLDPLETLELKALEEADSVQLFAERAVDKQPGFTLSNETIPVVARICHRLDGIPLAIELAAARMNLLSVEQIANRLEDGFLLLSGGNRSTLPRHRTMRASIDWSYDLLSDPERCLLQRLSIFSGSWSLETAESVCAFDPLKKWEVLELLGSLVNKSLVGVDSLSSTKPRYQMLETIRQYTQEKIEESGDGSYIGNRHLDYFLDLACKYGPHLKTSKITEYLDLLDPDLDNLRAAIAWALHKGSPEGAIKALHILQALDYFWAIRALYWEAFPLFKRALELLIGEDPQTLDLKAWGFYTLSTLQTDFNIENETIGLLNQSISLFRQVNNHQGLALALALRSYLIFRHDHFYPPDPMLSRDNAQKDLEESSTIAQNLSQSLDGNNARVLAWVDCWNGAGEVFRPDPLKARALGFKVQGYFQKIGDILGEQYGLLEWLMSSIALGDIDRLIPHIHRAIDMAQRIHHKRYLSFFTHQMITVLYALEQYDEMLTYAQQGLFLQHQMGSQLGELECYQFLGVACLNSRDYSHALKYLREGLLQSTKEMNYRDPFNILGILVVFAGLAAQIQQYRSATRLLGFIEEQLAFYAKNLDAMFQRELTRCRDKTQIALSESDFKSFLREGYTMSLEQAVAQAWEIN